MTYHFFGIIKGSCRDIDSGSHARHFTDALPFGELTHLGRFENAEDHRGRKKNKVGVDNKRHL